MFWYERLLFYTYLNHWLSYGSIKNFETYQIFRFSENQRVDNNFFMVYTIFYVKNLAG